MLVTIHRAEHSENCTTFRNELILNNYMSMKATMLLLKLLSSERNNLSYKYISTICQEGSTAINSALNELEANGHLVRTRVHINGRFNFRYDVYEMKNKEERIRLKTKITIDLEKLFYESASITSLCKETEGFLKKYGHILCDDRLNPMARGLILFILSFPKDTVLTVDLLKNVMAESRYEIKKCLEELECVGYIKEIDSLTEEKAYIRNVD